MSLSKIQLTERKQNMQFLTDALSATLLAAQIASPVIPAIIGSIVIVLVAIYFFLKNSARKKKMKKLYMSSEFGMEIDAEQIKKESKSRFTYERGYIPGKMPKMAFLDPERVGAPHEVVRVRETYAPSMQLPEELNKRKGELAKGAGAPLSVAKGANPYVGVTLNAVAPLAIPVTEKLEKPVLTPVPEMPALKMPLLQKEATMLPPVPKQKPLMKIKNYSNAQMPAGAYGVMGAQDSSQNANGIISNAQKGYTLSTLKIVDGAGEVTISQDSLDKMKKEIKEELVREMGIEPTKAPSNQGVSGGKDNIAASSLLAAGAIAVKDAAESKAEAPSVKKVDGYEVAMLSPIVRQTSQTAKPKLKGSLKETPVAQSKPFIVKNKRENTQNEYQINQTNSRPVELAIKNSRSAEPAEIENIKEKTAKQGKKPLSKKLREAAEPRFDENCMLTPEQIYIDELPLHPTKKDSEPVAEPAIKSSDIIASVTPELENAAQPESVAEAVTESVSTPEQAAPVAVECAEQEADTDEKEGASFISPIVIPTFTSRAARKAEPEMTDSASAKSNSAASLIAAEVLRRAKAEKMLVNIIPDASEEELMPESEPASEIKDEPVVTIDPIVEASAEKSNVIVVKVPEDFLKNSILVLDSEDDCAEADADKAQQTSELQDEAGEDVAVNEPCLDALPLYDEQNDTSVSEDVPCTEEDVQEQVSEEMTADGAADDEQAIGDEEAVLEEVLIYNEPVQTTLEQLKSAPLVAIPVVSAPDQVVPDSSCSEPSSENS